MAGGQGKGGDGRAGRLPSRLTGATAASDGRDEPSYRRLFVDSPVSQLLVDVAAGIVRVNGAFARLVGRPAEDLDGELAALAHLLAAPGTPGLDEEVDRFAAAGLAAISRETVLTRGDGGVLPARLVLGRLDDPSAGPPLVTVLVEDLAERRERDEQLVQARKMEAVGRLAGGVAHDVNNLLTVVGGYLELIESTLGADHAVTHEVGEIRAAARRASALVERLHTYTRRRPLRLGTVDLGGLVRDLERSLRETLHDRVELVLRLPDTAAPVLADPDRVREVVLALARNGQEAMDEEGRLEVRVQPPAADTGWNHPPELPTGRYARVHVRDTGAGMDPTTRSRCFEPFFTTKGRREADDPGLAAAYAVATQSGGTLSVRSAPGEGSEFTLWLPEPAAAGPPEVSASPAAEGLLLGSGMVLVAEDEVSVRAFLRITLERAGYTVLAAPDGEHALQLAGSSGPFDLLVTDVVMPRLGGLALARRLMEAQPGLRVLLVSGYSGDVALLEDMPPGVRLLAKPFGPEELTEAVAELLADRKGVGS